MSERESLISRVSDSLDFAHECATHSIRRNIWDSSDLSDYSSTKSFIYFLEYFIGMFTAMFCIFTAEQQATSSPRSIPRGSVTLTRGSLQRRVFALWPRMRSVLSSEGGFIHKREMAKVIAAVETDFGQTDFGHRYPTDFGQTDFGQNRLWPNRVWPNRLWPKLRF